MSISKRLERRDFLQLSGLALAGAALGGCSQSPAHRIAESPIKTADEALERLLAGNKRFVDNKLDLDVSKERRSELVKEQHPFATIFGCVDSRVSPDLVFDRGPGDLFVARTAGQVVDKAVLGSLQYGIEHLHTPLLLVLGHQGCGAVKAAVEAEKDAEGKDKAKDHTEEENDIVTLVEAILPAVKNVKGHPGDLLLNAIKENVVLTVERLKKAAILDRAVKEGKLKIVGAIYSLETGAVEVTAA